MKSSQDEVSIRVFTTLTQISSFHFRPDNISEPYGAMMIMEGSRSAVPDDLSEEQLEVLASIIDSFDIDFKARIADIVWLRKRNFPMALKAIESYVEASYYLLEHDDTRVHAFECIKRAFKLARSLGKGANYQYEMVLENIQKILFNQDPLEVQYFSLRLMELLRETQVDNFVELAQLSETIASNHEDQGEQNGANSYWLNAAYLHDKVEQYEEVKNCRVKAAECYVKMAEHSSSAMVGANFLQKSIEAYRRIGGHQSRTDELYDQLLIVQEKMASELHRVSTDIDVTELLENAISSIKGKPFIEAIQNICLLSHPQSIESLRKSIEKLVKSSPMQFLVSSQILDSEGKTVAVYPNMMDPNEKEAAMEAHMMNHTQFQRVVTVVGSIEPARKQILLEHNVSISILMPLLTNNPFVPVGREYIVAKGLIFGFNGEWIEATNILIPQFEESIRYVLKQNGEVVSGMDANNLQDVRSLNTTLLNPLMGEIFGKDLVFELKALLINRYGANLRNKVSHGLMHTSEYYTYNTVYFWWTYLRLICWPMLIKRQKNTN